VSTKFFSTLRAETSRSAIADDLKAP